MEIYKLRVLTDRYKVRVGYACGNVAPLPGDFCIDGLGEFGLVGGRYMVLQVLDEIPTRGTDVSGCTGDAAPGQVSAV